jgi:hypothetical protein
MRSEIKITVTVALFIGLLKAEGILDADRELQSLPSFVTPTKSLKYYGDDYRVAWAQNLGCGACINGGYTFCFQGKEGDDMTGKTFIQKCCKDTTSANCPEATNAAYTCSSIYTDRALAKSICPFKQTACGPKNFYEYVFYGAFSKDNVTINLAPGETCSYMMKTKCGVPSYKPSRTDGFDIESIDYATDELTRLRFLQSLPPPPPPPTPTPTPTPTPVTTTPPPPPPPTKRFLPKNAVPTRRKITTVTNNGTTSLESDDFGVRGAVHARYRPDYDNGKRAFKGGKRSINDDLCEERFSLVYVTNLQGVSGLTVATSVNNNYQRVLQSVPPPPPPTTTTTTTAGTNSMSLILASEYFSAAFALGAKLVAVLGVTALLF